MRMSTKCAVLASAAVLILSSDLTAAAMTLEQAYAECRRTLEQTTDYNGIVAQAIEACARQKMQESPGATGERRPPRHISRPSHRGAPGATEVPTKQGGGDSGGR